MRIHIADRLKWFSHIPGLSCLLPGTSLVIKAFPAKIFVSDLKNPTFKKEWELPFVKNFTFEQDLEKGTLKVFGMGKEKFHSYWIGLKEKELVLSSTPLSHSIPSKEKLSLGCHKAHELCKMKRRLNMGELFPFWLKLGLKLQKNDCFGESLLKTVETKPSLEAFQELFLAGFEGFFTPRFFDQEWHGFSYPPISLEDDPLVALSRGAHLIRQLFLRQEENTLFLLPKLFFPFGKMTDVSLPGIGFLHLEWSKKFLRRMVLCSQESKEVHLVFQKDLKTCRLRLKGDSRGKRVSCPLTLMLSPNTTYYFDNFLA